MNFLVKHVLVSIATHQIVKHLIIPYGERFIATYGPQQHEEYVEHVTELWNAKFEAFMVRNANLTKDDTLDNQGSLFDDEHVQQAFDLLSRMTKDFHKQKGSPDA